MLTTLVKLGKQLSSDLDEWDDYIDYPNIETEKIKKTLLHIAELVFDLDKQAVYIGDLKDYDEERSCREYKYIKIQGGNNKAIYSCVESGKLEQIRKTFFGAIDSKGNSPVSGQFQEAIRKDFSAFKNTLFSTLLPKIFALKEAFERIATTIKDDKGQEKKKVDESLLLSGLKSLPANAKVILFYTSVLSSADNICDRTALKDIEGFEEIMRAKFLDKGKQTEGSATKKISYATGLKKEDVTAIDFPKRYSLNYMFVDTTLNYASGFDKKAFQQSYQVSREEQLFLERGSKYILKNLKIRIAGIDHCIIPQFLHSTEIDIQYITESLFQQNELLFSQASIDRLGSAVEVQTTQPFWLTYLGFESDGNFFKTITQIKDVSTLHFYRVIETFRKINAFFNEELNAAVDWPSVTTEYGKTLYFNLASIYSIIPIRKEKVKNNEALSLFKSIFENRKIDPVRLFKSFCELVLCHWFRRYKSYTNLTEKKDDERSFDFAVRDAVFKYFAFIQALKHLNLLTIMEENEIPGKHAEVDTPNDYSRNIYAFLDKMEYNADQRAMFFLGRMLNAVAYMQEGKKKTVLDKVNFNGMQPRSILRLRNSLMEKAKQYDEIRKIKFIDGEFTAHFKYETWKMNPQEAIFFLLSGYSYGIIKSKGKETINQTPSN